MTEGQREAQGSNHCFKMADPKGRLHRGELGQPMIWYSTLDRSWQRGAACRWKREHMSRERLWNLSHEQQVVGKEESMLKVKPGSPEDKSGREGG